MNVPNDQASGSFESGDEIRAAEYVLGVLDHDERIRTAARIRTERDFAERVERWQAHFQRWLLMFPHVAPPARLRDRVARSIGLDDADGASSTSRVSPWAWAAAAAIAVAIGTSFWAIRVTRDTTTKPATAQVEPEVPKPVATLRRPDGSIGWLASIDRPHAKIYMVPVPSPDDASGLVDELWLEDRTGKPISLGFVSNQKAHTVALPATAISLLDAGSELSISLEKKEGIPHAARSDRLVARGAIGSLN